MEAGADRILRGAGERRAAMTPFDSVFAPSYRERVPFAPPLAYWGVLSVAFGGIVAGIALPFARGSTPPLAPGYFVALASAGLILAAVALAFRVLTVEAGPVGLVAAFGVFRKRIPRASIVDARPAAYRWTRYGGWGWRLARGGEALSVLTTRRGVELTVRTRRERTKTVFVSCRVPERVVEALGPAA